MTNGFARHIIDSYLNKTLTLLALVFVVAIVIFGLGDHHPRTVHAPLSGELADNTPLK